ncbi:MRL1 [Symbiodinium sp. CCMP2592]|nr:MRL1 [Symbiodinium sp. CCMP2592]
MYTVLIHLSAPAPISPRPQVLVSLGRSRRWVEALTELERALSSTEKAKAGQTRTACVNAALTACRLGSAWQVALEALRKLLRGGGSTPSPDHITFATCILVRAAWDVRQNSAGQNAGGNDRVARSLESGLRADGGWLAMRSHRIPLTTGVFNAALICLQRSQQWQASLQLLEGMDDHAGLLLRSSLRVNSVLASCGATATNWLLVLALLNEARTRYDIGPLSTVSYNTTMAACGRALLWQASLSLLEELRSRVAFSSAARGLSRPLEHKGAPVLLLDDNERPLPPGEGLASLAAVLGCLLPGCNAVLSGCERASLWLKALNLLAAMSLDKDWPRPDVVSYNSCISACEKATSWTWAVHLLASLSSDLGRPPDAISLNGTALALTRATRWPAAVELLCLAQKLGSIRLNAVSSLVLVTACGQGGLWERALSELCVQWHRLSDDPITQRNVYNATMSAFEQSRRWAQALDLLQKGWSKSMVLDQVAVNTAASACALRWEVALEVLGTYRLSSASDPEGAAGLSSVGVGCAGAGAWVWAVRLLVRASQQEGWWSKNAAAHIGGLAVVLLGAVRACENYLQAPTLHRLLRQPTNALSGVRLLLWDLVSPLQGLKDEGLRAELSEMFHRHQLSDEGQAAAPARRRLQSAATTALHGLRDSAGFWLQNELERQFLPGSLTRNLMQGLALTSRRGSWSQMSSSSACTEKTCVGHTSGIRRAPGCAANPLSAIKQ